jgi:pimeloyl-ACP methyl ester carboxylesterase
VARKQASGDRIGSLVYNPGGPGVGGVEYVRAADGLVGGDVLEHFDFVSFDPRGTGSSDPIDCISDQQMDTYLNGDSTPDDEAEIASQVEANRSFGAGCVQKSSPLVRHAGTLSVVRDMDVLRSALGEDTLTFLGASYGTFIGAWYAQTFPWRVGRMVLDGAVDPSLDLAGYVAGQAQGFDRGLTDYLDWCLDRRDCSLRGTPSEARSQLGSVLQKADGTPMTTDDAKRPLTQSLMVTGIAQGLYADSLWESLNDALSDALKGDGTALLALADRYDERSADGHYGAVMEANPAIFCLDHSEPRSTAEIEAAADDLDKRYPPLGGAIGWGALGCAEWPVPGVMEPRRTTADGAAPILVVGTKGDPATPYEWAQGLASQLSSGHLLTWEGSGHTAYRRGGNCIDDVIEAYLVAGKLPVEDKHCPE